LYLKKKGNGEQSSETKRAPRHVQDPAVRSSKTGGHHSLNRNREGRKPQPLERKKGTKGTVSKRKPLRRRNEGTRKADAYCKYQPLGSRRGEGGELLGRIMVRETPQTLGRLPADWAASRSKRYQVRGTLQILGTSEGLMKTRLTTKEGENYYSTKAQ